MRETLFKVLEQTTDYTIFNSASVNWSAFPWTNGYYSHKISQLEIERPYLLSVYYYGTIEYEDIILLLNNISDIFDVVPGSEFKIPKIEDVKKFLFDNKI